MSESSQPPTAFGRRFTDRVAIVTGAGQGIGRAAARRLGLEGARVMVADRNADGAMRVVDELKHQSIDADAVVADLGTAAQATELMSTAHNRFGRIDVLVNCVGGSMYGPKHAWEYSPEEIERNVSNNLWTSLWCCWAVLPHMLRQGRGAIVNVGSNAPRGTMRMPYAAAKGGVFALTTSLGLEVASMGIRVNAIAPHWTTPDDRLVNRLGEPVPAPARPTGSSTGDESSSQLAERHLRNIPMGRAGRPEEQAAAIAFLASDDASFITAQVLSVAGGAIAW